MPIALSFLVVFFACVAFAPMATAQPTPKEQAIAILQASLKADSWSDQSVVTLVTKLREVLGRESAGVKRLIKTADGKPLDAEQLRKRAESFLSDLSFKPLLEAETPVGWPAFTTVGEVELKDYPAYRMARVSMPESAILSSSRAFWKLFQHIQTHNIAMTAPVQMDYPKDGESTMAFLYGDGVVAPQKVEEGVAIMDVPAGSYLSIGLRGSLRPAAVVIARTALDAWLKEHTEYEALSGYRTLGWNSPKVSRDRAYHEVQIPVRKKLPVSPAAPGQKSSGR